MMISIFLCSLSLFGADNPIITQSEVERENYYIILDPNERTQLSTRITSPVKKIHKRMGDSFDEGDILIQLDDEIYLANYIKAKAVREKTKTELDAKKALFEDEAASLFELKEAEANAAIAYAELINAKESYEETSLTAPYKGKVVSIFIEEHELPERNAQLIEVIDDMILKAKFLVSSEKQIKLGMPVYIHINETDETIEAVVSRISPQIDPSSKTIKVEAEIDNKDGKLKSGMSGIAYF